MTHGGKVKTPRTRRIRIEALRRKKQNEKWGSETKSPSRYIRIPRGRNTNKGVRHWRLSTTTTRELSHGSRHQRRRTGYPQQPKLLRYHRNDPTDFATAQERLVRKSTIPERG